MKLKLGIPVLALVCSATLLGQGEQKMERVSQARSGFPTSDTSYKSSYVPKKIKIEPGMRVKDDARARREWMKERFGGPLTAEVRDAMLSEVAAVRAAHPEAFSSGGGAGTWTSVGPVRSNWIQNGVRLTKSDTGRVRTILPNTSNPDVVYLLTSGGGLWKTSNFLSPRPTWEPKSDGIGVAGGAVTFGANENTVLLGFGDPFDGGIGGFVAKSTTGGDSWGAPQGLGASTIVTDIKSSGNTVIATTDAGLWRSTNNGDTFAPVGLFAGSPGAVSWSVVKAAGAWLASYEIAFQLPDKSVHAFGAIYRSTDDGATWTPALDFGDANIGRVTLGVAAAEDPVVYAFAAQIDDASQSDLFRSSDAGLTWTPLNLKDQKPANPNEDQPDMDIMAGQAFYNQMLLVDPTDASRNTVYIGGQLSSARSTDGGKSWRLVSHWLAQYGLPYVHADFHAAAFSGTKTLMFGTDGGLFVSTDGGASWSDRKNDGIASYLVYALATNDKNTSDVIIGLQDNGTRLRVGNSETFNQVFGGDGFGVGWGSDGVSLGSIYYSFLFRTPNGQPATQQKWQVGYNGIDEDEFLATDPETGDKSWPNPAMTQFITNVHQPSRAAAPNGRTFYHRTKYTLYRSTNSGAVWQPVGAFKLNRNASQGEFRGVAHPIGIGFNNEQEIAVAMSGGQVAISEDGGKTMRIEDLRAPRIPNMGTFVTATAWAKARELYVSTENPNPAAPHLLRSKDAGKTWERLDGVGDDPTKQLPRVPLSRIVVSPRNPNTVYVGTWIGVFVSTDAGATWAPLGKGLPLAWVNDMYVSPDGGLLRVASYGRGIWDYRF